MVFIGIREYQLPQAKVSDPNVNKWNPKDILIYGNCTNTTDSYPILVGGKSSIGKYIIESTYYNASSQLTFVKFINNIFGKFIAENSYDVVI